MSIRSHMVDMNRWLRPHMANLPELELFPDDTSRQRAIESIERNMRPRSLTGLLEFVVVVAGAFLLPLHIIEWVVDLLFGAAAWRGLITYPATILAYCGIIFVLLRGEVPRDLRTQLLSAGVPVCLKCGYGLRGLDSGTTRCPECGRRFSPQVASMIQQAKSNDDRNGNS